MPNDCHSAADPGPPLLRVRNLGFQRGERWLFRHLSFDLHRGRFIALVGPSGVGKTSLLACLCGMQQPTEGRIEIQLDPNHRPLPPQQVRPHLGIIFQNLQLIANADLLTNVACGRLARLPWFRTLFGFPRRFRLEAYRILEELGIARDPAKWAAEMSGGEQQRVAVARALFQNPTLFFADEPVSNLDSYYAGRVLGLLRQQADKENKGVLCVLHQAEHIQRFADFALSLNSNDPTAHRFRPIRSEPEPLPAR